ncbi:3-phosphoinositide-dependent protein kinase 1-like [Tropilaelaps mercedesae]|uniref:3-phosphoinositide-dependent protein kinase 1 n=1 Tax=Tropilaelaps mercedesae TaxID=418985 RepID=A0A1V9Y0R7_9ACAR|nr:3-phosphoinositide-dependent protein kinase 1-like [Tropilaelaps mercedesae]
MPDRVVGTGGDGGPSGGSRSDSSGNTRRDSETSAPGAAAVTNLSSGRRSDQSHQNDKQSGSNRDTQATNLSEGHRPTVNDFYFGKMLGEGSFSVVYLAKEARTEKKFAIKVCDKAHIVKEKKQAAVHREKHILSELCRKPHPLVIGLHCTFHDETRLYFVISYAKNGDLLKYIHKVGNFNAECTRFYSGEIMAALRYLHRAGVVHRDVKPENVLITEKMHIMVADFGSAQILLETSTDNHSSAAGSSASNETTTLTAPTTGPSTTGTTTSRSDADTSFAFRVRPRPEGTISGDAAKTQDHQQGRAARKKRNSFVGTAQYVSPEVLTAGPVSPAMDMWALGCVIYQMVSGLPPFRGMADYHIFQSIIRHDYSYPEDFDEDARRVVESLLKLEPKKRATIEELERDLYYAGMDIDKLHLQTPPEIVPFLAGTSEEIDWGKVDAPGLDESQMSRLWGLHLGDETQGTESKEVSSTITNQPPKPLLNAIRPHRRNIMDMTEDEREQRLADQRCRSRWHKFVEGNLILKEGFVDKRKGLFPRRRMLLLTTGPHLYYVDPERMVLKGQIPWSAALTPEPKNFKTFFVHTPNRTYNLEDPEGYALRWCKAINEVYEATYGPRPGSETQQRNFTSSSNVGSGSNS